MSNKNKSAASQAKKLQHMQQRPAGMITPGRNSRPSSTV
jgi:hypothetical protein